MCFRIKREKKNANLIIKRNVQIVINDIDKNADKEVVIKEYDWRKRIEIFVKELRNKLETIGEKHERKGNITKIEKVSIFVGHYLKEFYSTLDL